MLLKLAHREHREAPHLCLRAEGRHVLVVLRLQDVACSLNDSALAAQHALARRLLRLQRLLQVLGDLDVH